uniref:Uncharacterized protein n=1 Tax=Timema tahoe TaxID=61484 RepID=A0A7R9P156_9NEOP|nr:unnamed protein product [Timema tahoe]
MPPNHLKTQRNVLTRNYKIIILPSSIFYPSKKKAQKIVLMRINKIMNFNYPQTPVFHLSKKKLRLMLNYLKTQRNVLTRNYKIIILPSSTFYPSKKKAQKIVLMRINKIMNFNYLQPPVFHLSKKKLRRGFICSEMERPTPHTT